MVTFRGFFPPRSRPRARFEVGEAKALEIKVDSSAENPRPVIMFKVGPRETNEFSLFLGVHGDCRRLSEEVRVGGGEGDPDLLIRW